MTAQAQFSAQLLMFKENTLESETGVKNDTIQKIIMMLRSVGNNREGQLCVHIIEELSPEMMFKRETAPFYSLQTYLKNFLSDRGA